MHIPIRRGNPHGLTGVLQKLLKMLMSDRVSDGVAARTAYINQGGLHDLRIRKRTKDLTKITNRLSIHCYPAGSKSLFPELSLIWI